MSIAKKRWEILGEALLRKRIRTDNNVASTRRFSNFGLLQTRLICQDSEGVAWYEYTCTECPALNVQIRQKEGHVDLQDILGFNNTGNVCIWPSEEVLTYYCLKKLSDFRNKKIVELGGGMTCLCGISLSTLCECEEMLLSDGNNLSVHNVEKIIRKNLPQSRAKIMHSRVLRWGDNNDVCDIEESFDYALCADCCFFDDGREALIDLLYKILRPEGEAIVVAPNRNGTFFAFAQLAVSKFAVTIYNKFDDYIWELHQQNVKLGKDHYDPDIHYPLLMVLKKL